MLDPLGKERDTPLVSRWSVRRWLFPLFFDFARWTGVRPSMKGRGAVASAAGSSLKRFLKKESPRKRGTPNPSVRSSSGSNARLTLAAQQKHRLFAHQVP